MPWLPDPRYFHDRWKNLGYTFTIVNSAHTVSSNRVAPSVFIRVSQRYHRFSISVSWWDASVTGGRAVSMDICLEMIERKIFLHVVSVKIVSHKPESLPRDCLPAVRLPVVRIRSGIASARPLKSFRFRVPDPFSGCQVLVRPPRGG